MNKRKLYGRPIKNWIDIRPILDHGNPTGKFAIVSGKKERFRGSLTECKELTTLKKK